MLHHVPMLVLRTVPGVHLALATSKTTLLSLAFTTLLGEHSRLRPTMVYCVVYSLRILHLQCVSVTAPSMRVGGDQFLLRLTADVAST